MRRLLLLRHAKSSWADPGARDHDRPLNERGRNAAPRMGDYLRREELLPDLVLCSSARRTCETVARLDLPDTTTIEVSHDLYLAHPETVVDLVRAVDDGIATLMVVGHNPTTHEVALDLANAGDADALARVARKFPTGALAVLTIDGGWAAVGTGVGSLERFVTPHDLG
jgi:phosphohistidine phosphatase